MLAMAWLLPGPAAAKAEAGSKAKDGGKSETSERLSFGAATHFNFDMEQQDAEEILQGEDWQILFRIDTTSVSEIAAVYKEQLFYRLGFYGGRCYSLEKRAEVPGSEVEAAFKSYGERYGETREATRNDSGSLVFSRWLLKGRELSLMSSASHSDNGLYKLTAEEVDPDTASQARHAQERELSELPLSIDPLTGRARLSRARQSDDDDGAGQGQDESGGEEEDSDSEPEK
jgi:hypothetical protein